MVVFPDRCVDACLVVDGRRLREYKDPNSTALSDAVSALVEVTPGSKFWVYVKFNGANSLIGYDDRDVECTVWLDGVYATTKRCFSSTRPNKCIIEGAWSDNTLRRFTFTPLLNDEEPTARITDEALGWLGRITIVLTFTQGISRPASNNHLREWQSVRDPVVDKDGLGLPISTRAELVVYTRRVVHRRTNARLSTAERIFPPSYTPTGVEYPHANKQSVTIDYKYRTRNELQIQGVISRSPLPLEDRDLYDLNLHEARELVRRLRARIDRDQE